MQKVIITIERAPNGQDVVKISADYQGVAALDEGNPAHQIAALLMQTAASLTGLETAVINSDAPGSASTPTRQIPWCWTSRATLSAMGP